MIIKKITFNTALPFLKNLWPTTNNILPASSMQYLGGNDITIYEKFEPSFFGMYNNTEIIGVVSGHKSSQEYYRMRGLWINEFYRNKGLSKNLFITIENQALKENCNFLWSFPRHEAIKAYISNGFVQTSKFLSTSYGLNCYALKKL